jgi:hypothetical protein
MREDPRIFFAHAQRHLLVGRCAFFIPWTTGVNIFSGERENGLRDEHADMRVAHGDAMVARERRCEYILRAKKMS